MHTASDLLAYEPFVRSIARGLLSDEERVGDVVQETWVRALSKPPRARGSLKSWLGRVTRNLALDEHRREARCRSREQLATGEEALREDEQGLELHGRIVEAVLALDEPYRSVVILRYFRDLSSAKIARQLKRKEATVRSQLHRAHDLLKSKLDQHYGDSRQAWLALCLPLASGRDVAGGAAMLAKAALVILALGAGATGVSWALELGESGTARDALAALDPLPNAEQHTAGAGSALAPDEPRAFVPAKRTPLASSILVLQDGAPAPGVDVWCVILSDVDQEAVKRQPGIDFDAQEFFPQFGVHSVTDADGRASLPRADSDFALLAVRGNYMRLLQTHETQTLPLVADLQRVAMVRVRALDAQGEPVIGVPIVLRSTQGPTPSAAWSTSRDARTRVTRAPNGEALFRGFELGAQPAASRTWSVRIGVPGVHSRQVVLDMASEALETLDLLLEPTLPLVVRSCDASGKPLPLQGTARLRSKGLEQATMDVPLVDGVAHFPFVGAGKPIIAVLDIPSLGARWTVNATAPKSVDESDPLDIRDPRAARLHGRVLDAQGEPMAHAAFHVMLFGRGQERMGSTQLETDAGGDFTPEHALSEASVSLTLLHYGERGLDSRAELAAPATLTGSLTELGDLVLFDAPGWVEGQCVGPEGQPLAGVSLVVDQRPGFGTSSGVSRAGGEFYLGGVFDEELHLRVAAGSDWVLESPISVRRGQRDVRVVLTPGGRLVGELLVDEGLSMGAVRVRVRATTPIAGPWRPVALAPNGHFEADGLRGGMYDLELRYQGFIALLLRDVAVTLGQSATDERLAQVDLRGRLCKLAFVVHDTGGKPLSAARATVVQAGGDLVETAANEDGALVVWCASDTDLVRIGAPGFRDVYLQGDEQSTPVQLQPAIAVRLKSTSQLELRHPGKAYFLSLILVETDPKRAGFVTRVALPSSLLAGREATVQFPEPGTYRLHFTLHYNMHAGHASLGAGDVPVEGGFTVEIQEQSQGLSVPLNLPAELP